MANLASLVKFLIKLLTD